MAEETKKDETEKKDNTENKPSFKTADELSTFLMDLQGQMVNMQETIDKLSPKEEQTQGSETEKETTEETLSEEEVSEVDKLLQSE